MGSACQSSEITAINAKELKCNGYRACYNGVFDLTCTEDEPCEISCEGDEACRGVNIMADYVSELTCKDDNACTDATIIISDAANDFSIECSDGGCVNSQISINSTNDLGEIKCSESGCIGTTFDISYALTGSISIETIDCDGEDACKDAVFTFNGDIRVDECKCGEVGDEDFGCDGTSGLTTTQCNDGGIDVNILAANAMANLWGLAAMCLLVNLIALFCCYRGTNKSVAFESNAANERYVSDQ